MVAVVNDDNVTDSGGISYTISQEFVMVWLIL